MSDWDDITTARLYLAYSAGGKGKTSFSLSGKGKKGYMEFDPGSLARAVPGLKAMGVKRDDVDVYKAEWPFEWDDITRLNTAMVGASGKGAVQVVPELSGFIEMRKNFRNAFGKMLKESDIRDIIMDTETFLWDMEQLYLKEKFQHDLNNMSDSRLKTLEFESLNNDMTQYHIAAKQADKNLIWLCHEKEVWVNNEPSGRFVSDGWKEAEGLADVALRFTVKDREPHAEIYKAGGTNLKIVGLEFRLPTIDSVSLVLDAASFLMGEDIPLPDEITEEGILSKARMVGFKGE